MNTEAQDGDACKKMATSKKNNNGIYDRNNNLSW